MAETLRRATARTVQALLLVSAVVAASPAAASATESDVGVEFAAVAPIRLADTRVGLGVPAGATEAVAVPVAGVGPIAPGADSVALNLTITNPRGDGFAVLFPAGTETPSGSSVNFRRGQTRSNLVIAKIGSGGRVAVRLSVPADVVVDAVGYFAAPGSGGPVGRLHGVAPARVLDSRVGLGVAQALAGGSVAELAVAGRAGVPPQGAVAVALNLTATNASAETYVSTFVAGGAPQTSTLNLGPGETRANVAIVPLAPNGTIALFNYAGTVDVVADVIAYVAPSGGSGGSGGSAGKVVVGAPHRLFDSRPLGITLTDQAPGTLAFNLGVGGASEVSVGAAIFNVIQVEPSRSTFLTVWPADEPQPLASNMNADRGDIVANVVIVPLGPGGRVNFANHSGRSGLVVDLVGVVLA